MGKKFYERHQYLTLSENNSLKDVPVGSKSDDPVQMYLNDIYTISANLAGIGGINVPIGFHTNGLPMGIQFMAPACKEERLIASARLIERLQA